MSKLIADKYRADTQSRSVIDRISRRVGEMQKIGELQATEDKRAPVLGDLLVVAVSLVSHND